ncbi:response regulator transcription factor [Paenibacillus wynnii]|nr:response regulator transcription factor [Paenibacillus wynnii]
MSNWVFNPMFGSKLKHINFSQEVDFTRDLLKTLLVMQETNPLIAEVYLYIDDNKTLISSSRGVNRIQEPSDTSYSGFRKLMETNQNFFWTKSLFIPGISDNPLLHTELKYNLIHKLPSDSSDKYGVLVVRLDEAKVKLLFSEIEDSEATLLLDHEGDILSRGDQKSPHKAFLEESVRNKVFAHWKDQKQETFPTRLENKNYSISYYTFSRLDTNWIFATAYDVSNVLRPVIVMSRVIMIISVSGLLTAIILSWLASQRLYQPIARLIGAISNGKLQRGMENGDELRFIEKEWNNLSRESQILQTRVEEQLPTLREGFMLQLVQGRLYYLSDNELKSRLSYYGWKTVDQQFTVILLQLNGLMNVGGKFTEEDEQLVTFAAANIVDELTDIRLEQTYVINFQDSTVGIIIGMPLDLPVSTIKKELTQLSEEIISILDNILKLQVTVCMGPLSPILGRVPKMIEEARHTLKFRKLIEDNQIIDMDSLLVTGDFTFVYPFEIEKELIYAIRLGQREEAFSRAEDFVAELEKNVGVQHFVQQAMAQLVGNINNALLQAGFNVYSIYKGQNIYGEIQQLRQTQEMLKWFKNMIITPYLTEMNETYNSQMTQVVEKVVRLVDDRYMTDLSLEECADLLGVNVSSLSKTFKQIKGINYVDYVTNVRIEASKKLLEETNMKISEIAEKVGYQHSWFNRVFKKSEGVTPTQYRENKQ